MRAQSPLAYLAMVGLALSVSLSIGLAVLGWALCRVAAKPTPSPFHASDQSKG